MSSFNSALQSSSPHTLMHQSYSFPVESESAYGHDLLSKPELNKNLSVQLPSYTPLVDGYGTPSYPSPLDRIRSGRRERAAQLGLPIDTNKSFEANQSFPKITARPLIPDTSKSSNKIKLGDFRGQGLNDVSFSAGHSRGSFVHSDSDVNINKSWSFHNYLGGSAGVCFPTTVRNPNKAICTINSETSQILIVNEMACELFGYREDELVTMQLCHMIKLKGKQQTTLVESHVEETTGLIVEVSGKVVDAVDCNGLHVPISLWVKALPNEGEGRCLVVMEPVERTVASVKFSAQGIVLGCDLTMCQLYGYSTIDDIIGLHINQLIPALKLPKSTTALTKDICKQRATGRSRVGGTFPLSITLQPSNEDSEQPIYEGVIWVFANISGLISFLKDGSIHSINENFALMMFGYTSHELIGQDISILIPDFYQIIEDIESVLPIQPITADCVQPTQPMTAENANNTDTRKEHAADNAVEGCTIPERGEDEKDPVMTPLNRVLGGHIWPMTSTPDCKHQKRVYDGEVSGCIEKMYQKQLDMEMMNCVDNKENCDRLRNEVTAIATTFSTLKRLDNLSDSKYLSFSDTSGVDKHNSEKDSVGFNPDSWCIINDESHGAGPFLSDSSQRSEYDTTDFTNITLNDSSHQKPPSPEVLKIVTDNIRNNRNKTGAMIRQSHSSHDVSGGYKHDHEFGQTYNACWKSPKHRRKLDKSPSASWRSSSDLYSTAMYAAETLNSLSPVSGHNDFCSGKSTNRRHKLTKSPKFLTVDSPNEGVEIADVPSFTNTNSFCVNVTPPTESEKNSSKTFAVSKTKIPSDHSIPDPQSGTDPDNETKHAETSAVISSSGQTDLFHKMFQKHAMFAQNGRSKAVCADGDNSPELLPKSPSPTRPCVSTLSLDKQNRELIRRALRGRVLSNKNESDTSRSGSNSPFMSAKHSLSGSKPASSDLSIDSVPADTHTQPRNLLSSLSHQSSVTGNFCGECRHKDGLTFGVVFQVKRVTLVDGEVIFCIWMSRDPEDPGEGCRSFTNLTLASSLHSSTNISHEMPLTDSFQHHIDSNLVTEPDRSVHNQSASTLLACRGEYSQHYTTIRCIGKGAYGFVRLAHRITDSAEVVVKFIRRSKIHSDNWCDDATYGFCPTEISLLSQLDHPNIVKILDVYRNDDFYQLVMEKHGSGMDLFEFIDRSPDMDEPLSSYIFRQLVSATAYLHDRGIVHRDIKDENVIINELFHVKLIDFGAAAFLKAGALFATFCGTIEYCSPEVLLGNKYSGPEQDVWSLGVTLYTLVFGENPFYDDDEIISCVLKPPVKVSNTLIFLLTWMLHRDPKDRMTIPHIEAHSWVSQCIDISLYSWSTVLPNSDFHGNLSMDHDYAVPTNVFHDTSDNDRSNLTDDLYHHLHIYNSSEIDPLPLLTT